MFWSKRSKRPCALTTSIASDHLPSPTTEQSWPYIVVDRDPETSNVTARSWKENSDYRQRYSPKPRTFFKLFRQSIVRLLGYKAFSGSALSDLQIAHCITI